MADQSPTPPEAVEPEATVEPEAASEQTAPEAASDQTAVRLTTEPGERIVVLRAVSTADIWSRPRLGGPFGSTQGDSQPRAALLDELIVTAGVRTRVVHSVSVGSRRSWGPLVVGLLPGDVEPVQRALTALFDEGDEAPLREWLRRPGPLPPRGPLWEPPRPGEGFAGR